MVISICSLWIKSVCNTYIFLELNILYIKQIHLDYNIYCTTLKIG